MFSRTKWVVFILGFWFAPECRGLDDEMAEVARALRESCMGETGQKEDMLNEINKGLDIPDDPTLKCYMKCFMESAGMLSDSVVEIETVLALMPDDMRVKNEASVRKCGSPQGADECDVAWKTQVCWQKANKADYFIV